MTSRISLAGTASHVHSSSNPWQGNGKQSPLTARGHSPVGLSLNTPGMFAPAGASAWKALPDSSISKSHLSKLPPKVLFYLQAGSGSLLRSHSLPGPLPDVAYFCGSEMRPLPSPMRPQSAQLAMVRTPSPLDLGLGQPQPCPHPCPGLGMTSGKSLRRGQGLKEKHPFDGEAN